MPTQLSSVAATLLPPTVADPIFAKATEMSAVQQLARKVPLAINAQHGDSGQHGRSRR
jgi:hypothetical protein